MELTSQVVGDALIVSVGSTRIDAAAAIQFKEKFRSSTQDAPERIVLDMEQVEFVDSSGLGAIVAAMKHLGNEHRLELAALTATVDKVFRLTRMNTVMTIHGTLEEAVNGVKRAG
ncbi:MAG: STAS domain-containing protein [Pseudomonadota bacterium]